MIRKMLPFLFFALFAAGCASTGSGGRSAGVMLGAPKGQSPSSGQGGGSSNPWVK